MDDNLVLITWRSSLGGHSGKFYIHITRDSPDCHKAIPFDPSKLYKFDVLVFFAVITLLAVLAVFAILAVMTLMAVLTVIIVLAIMAVLAVMSVFF